MTTPKLTPAKKVTLIRARITLALPDRDETIVMVDVRQNGIHEVSGMITGLTEQQRAQATRVVRKMLEAL
jgi:hypothetical protein